MFDVIFKQARLGDQAQYTTAEYAAQDLEGQPIGPVQPFTYSVQSGIVFLGLDFITPNPVSTNEFAGQDFESFPIGPISIIPIPLTALATPSVFFNKIGVLTPTLNIGSDDLESYPIGPIVALTQSFFSGDITLKTGQLRPYP